MSTTATCEPIFRYKLGWLAAPFAWTDRAWDSMDRADPKYGFAFRRAPLDLVLVLASQMHRQRKTVTYYDDVIHLEPIQCVLTDKDSVLSAICFWENVCNWFLTDARVVIEETTTGTSTNDDDDDDYALPGHENADIAAIWLFLQRFRVFRAAARLVPDFEEGPVLEALAFELNVMYTSWIWLQQTYKTVFKNILFVTGAGENVHMFADFGLPDYHHVAFQSDSMYHDCSVLVPENRSDEYRSARDDARTHLETCRDAAPMLARLISKVSSADAILSDLRFSCELDGHISQIEEGFPRVQTAVIWYKLDPTLALLDAKFVTANVRAWNNLKKSRPASHVKQLERDEIIELNEAYYGNITQRPFFSTRELFDKALIRVQRNAEHFLKDGDYLSFWNAECVTEALNEGFFFDLTQEETVLLVYGYRRIDFGRQHGHDRYFCADDRACALRPIEFSWAAHEMRNAQPPHQRMCHLREYFHIGE